MGNLRFDRRGPDGQGGGAPCGDSRSRGAALAALIGLQFLGYLLLWLALHAVIRSRGLPVSSQLLISSGWYDQGSAYATRVGRLPVVAAILDARRARGLLLVPGFILASAGWAATLLLLRRSSPRLGAGTLVFVTLALALPLLLLPQILTTDVWSYVMYGRIAALHGGNPFLDPPSAYPGDPFLARVYWKTTPSIYGPAWVMTSSLLTRVAQSLGGAPGTYLLTFKGFFLACHLANVFLVRRILRVIRPGRETLGAVFYGWNPLVLLEFAGGAHNDCFMLTLLLAGVACAAVGRGTVAVAWLAAAGLAKLPGILALPAYTLFAARTSPGRPAATLARHALVASAVAIALYAPYWRGPATLRGTANAPNLRIMYHSPAAGVSKFVERRLAGGVRPKEWWQEEPAPGSRPARVRSAVRHGSLVCFFLCLAALTLVPIRDFDGWIERTIWIYISYLLFAAYQFNPWYGTWLVALAPLLRRPWPLLAVTSILLLLFYLPLDLDGSAALYFWPLLLLILVQVPRLARRRVAAGESFLMQPTSTSLPSDSSSPARPMPAPPSRPRLGVVTPLANEEQTVGEFLRRVLAQLGEADRVFCVLDNASKDRTRELVEAAAAADPRVACVWAPENRCVRDAYFRGYREALEAGCRWVLEIDGGLSHLPEQIPRFVEAMEGGADYAAGSRFCRGGRFHGKLSRRLVSWGGSRLSNLLLGTRMRDMCSGFECFTHAALSHVVAAGVSSRANFFQTEIRFLLRHWRWVEVPITYHGPPKSLAGSTVREALSTLWALRGRMKAEQRADRARAVGAGLAVELNAGPGSEGA